MLNNQKIVQKNFQDPTQVKVFQQVGEDQDHLYVNPVTGVQFRPNSMTEMPGFIRTAEGKLFGPGDREFNGYFRKINAKTGEVVEGEANAHNYQAMNDLGYQHALDEKARYEAENQALLNEIEALRSAAALKAGDSDDIAQAEEDLRKNKKAPPKK